MTTRWDAFTAICDSLGLTTTQGTLVSFALVAVVLLLAMGVVALVNRADGAADRRVRRARRAAVRSGRGL